MTRPYPECDSYTCEACPREATCEIREQPEPDPLEPMAMLLSRLQEQFQQFKQEMEEEFRDLRERLDSAEETISAHDNWVCGVQAAIAKQLEGGEW